MKYAILIYGDESLGEQASPEETKQVTDAWWAYEGELQKSEGTRLAGEALQPTATATTVRTRDGKTTTTDGPFAETKEQLGGFYLIEAKDLDEALEWAVKCPGAAWGTIELRPIQEFEPPQ
ncbi:MAG: YciI family protein [Actinomycetota bacterium]